MESSMIITQESTISDNDLHCIEDFWANGVFSSFIGAKNITIEYAYFIKNKQLPTIVISPGRSESYLKYKEVIYDLHTNNYNVFIIDHRGQGLSGRVLTNTNKGYVEYFDLYADDLYQFIISIVNPLINNLPYLLAHSMGCAISIRMFQLYPQVIKNSVLLSPMITINSGPIPYALASGVIRIGQAINNALTEEPWYFIRQSNYKPTPFHKNVLTHSVNRYKKVLKIYNTKKEIQLGGVTFQWLYQAINNEKALFNDITKISTPLLILQAGDDRVVSNQAQHLFCQKLHTHDTNLCSYEPIEIQTSYHELLFESDNIRNQTFSYIFNHLK